MKIVQSHNWQYFIETLLQISNGQIDIRDLDKYLTIQKTLENLNYCKEVLC